MIKREDVASLYGSLLGREPEPDAMAWFLATFTSRKAAEVFLRQSAEFKQRHNPEPPPYDVDYIRESLAAGQLEASSASRPDAPTFDQTVNHLELAPWIGLDISRSALLKRFEESVNESRFILSITGREVRVLEKPSAFPHPQAESLDERVQMYADFLGAVLQERNLDLNCLLLVETQDMAPNAYEEIPIFSYQKLAGANTISLPDIEFLSSRFYSDPTVVDHIAYPNKRDAAAFLGSTSGYPYLLTRQHVENRTSPRLRAAEFFRGKDEVDFRVTNLVQTDGPETDALIRAMGLVSPRMPFADLYGYRFIISMDGNGATCSRVVLALASQAVLLKYQSDYGLYYFPALKPWLHYVPIHRDADVLAVVAYERAHPGAFAHVAEASRQFVADHLTRERVVDYTAALIAAYADLFNGLPEG